MHSDYQTLKVRQEDKFCFVQIYRPEANNAISELLVHEFTRMLDHCADSAVAVVIEGLPGAFCVGADFSEIEASVCAAETRSGPFSPPQEPGPLYDLWARMATMPSIVVSHVRGKVNAGGMGFVAASDIVLADSSAQFSLSEMMFGLVPACVLPFLIRRVGFQRAHFMTVSTMSFGVEQACNWGLVDAWETDSCVLLEKHLLRLGRMSKLAVARYKNLSAQLSPLIEASKTIALQANTEAFAQPENISGIVRYVREGIFPWEK